MARPLPTGDPTLPPDGTISAADLRWRVYKIADDSMRGRYPGTPGNDKVTAWVASEFRRLRLLPAGDDGSYFQRVPFLTTVLDTTQTLAVGDQRLALWHDYLPANISGTANRFDAAGTAVVDGGRLGDTTVHLPTVDGKLVVFEMARRPDGSIDTRSTRYLPIAKLSTAAAVAIVFPDALPAYLIDNRQPRYSLPRSGPPTATHTPILLYITGRTASALLAGSPLRGTVQFTGPDTVWARNVVAILPGTDPRLSNEYVAIGAHNDHIGTSARPVDHDSLRAYNILLARHHDDGPAAGNASIPHPDSASLIVNIDSLRKRHPPRRDSIFNGADDDGSGTAALVAIAQAFATSLQPTARSILFVSHAGEEQGALGSHWYGEHTTVPRDSIVTYLNMDMLGHGDSVDVAGGGPRYLQSGGARRLSHELGTLIDSVNASLAEPMKIDYSWDAPGHPSQKYCRSDQVNYGRWGIPSAYFSTGYSVDYHQLTDEPQYLNYDHMARVVRLVYAVATSVADLDHAPVIDGVKPDPNAPCRQ